MTVSAERAVLAGGCFWGVQDLLRRYPGVISTRVGYTGGEVSNATYRNHGNHAEAIEITFDPQTISYRKLLEFLFQIHDPSTLNARPTTGEPATGRPSFIPATRRSGSRKTPLPMSTPPAFGQVRLSPRWHLPVRSGRQSPSTRITWKNIRTATPVISFGRNGLCRIGRRML